MSESKQRTGSLESEALTNAKGPVASGEELTLLNVYNEKVQSEWHCKTRSRPSDQRTSVLQLQLATRKHCLEPKTVGKEVSLSTWQVREEEMTMSHD